MFRLIGVILLLGGLAAQLSAQVLREQGSAGQTLVEQPGSAAHRAAALSGGGAFPLDAFTDFSAVMVGSIMEIGEGTTEAHIYRSGKLMRMEGVEGRGYMITDLASLTTYGVSTGPCMYDTHPFFRASPFAAVRAGSVVERAPVGAGQETMDGHSCRVEDVTVSQSPGKPLKMRLWEAEDLQGFPIRIDVERPGGQHSTIRYKNVVLGPQDQTLFIHPKSCGSLPQRSQPKKRKAGTAHKKPAAASPGASSQK